MKRSEKTIGPYLIFLSIVVSWNGVWWFLVTPEAYPTVASKPEFTVQYFPITSEQGSVGIDPAIFSLPSRVGFSRAALLCRDSVLPPLDFEKSLSIFMPRSSEINSASTSLDVQPMNGQLIDLIKRGPIAGSVAPDVFNAEPGPPNKVAVDLEGVDLEETILSEWTEALSILTNKPWSIKMVFDTDPVGFVEHLFVEQSTGDVQLDRRLRLSMSRLQFVPDEKAGTGRLWIKHSVREGRSE